MINFQVENCTVTDNNVTTSIKARSVFITKYFSGDKITNNEVCGVWGHLTGNRRNTCRVLVGRTEGKRAIGRLRRRWKYNIKTDLREEGWRGIQSIYPAQDTDMWPVLVNVVMNHLVP